MKKRRTKQELAALDDALVILTEEHAPATVRQIYYRAVVAYLCDKTHNGYRLIQSRLLKLRRLGRIPYDWIADNARMIYGHTRYNDVSDFAEQVQSLYRRDYWSRNPVNLEIWCESDSIASTIHNTVVNQWGLDLHVSRGFSSETYLHNAAEQLKHDGRPAFVYTFSDFDPSGIILAEKIDEKLREFAPDVDLSIKRIALTKEQVDKWQLPTHPTKATDLRAKKFREQYGSESCELEAIPPKVLRELVSQTIARHADTEEFERLKRVEEMERESLVKRWGDYDSSQFERF